MNRKKILLVMLGLGLLAGLLACGVFGAKYMRRNRQRQDAMAAYKNGEYALAERLLLQYVQKDPDYEAGFVALAGIYHEFGNIEMEAQMWQTASSLNPQNREYRANMLNTSVKSASYAFLHGILSRKARANELLSDQELYLYMISSFRSGYPVDGEDAYQKYTDLDPEAFHKDDLGRMAEFMAIYGTLLDVERIDYLNEAMQSEDPVIRFEALYFAIRRCMEQRNDDGLPNEEEMERLLKQAAEVNHFAGSPLLADFYFSKYRFAETIDILEPYLKTIDDIDLYLQYAESCAFTGKTGELRALGKKLREKPGFLPIIADYCDILIAYLENDEEKLASNVRKHGKRIDSPLSRFIRLRVAMANHSFTEILTLAQEIFTKPPFFDLHNRALFICLDYISEEMKKPENQKDPSQMAELAKVLSIYLHGNRLLTEIILMDQYKRDLVKEDYLIAALDYFPDDTLLLRITATFLIMRGKAEEALPLIEQMLNAEKAANRKPDRRIQALFVLALDLLGRQDDVSEAFREMLEQTDFDPELLGQYFQFCLNNGRTADLVSMADKLEAGKDGKTERFAVFFRAAALLLTEDELKVREALDLLVSTPSDDPEFTFYAANCLCKYNRLDEAEKKYMAISETYRNPSLVYVNLSIIYHARGEDQKAMDAAKKAFELEKESLLPAFIYSKRLYEAERYEEAVNTLNFPRHAVEYRGDIIELWCDCMHHVIEKSLADRKILLAENQCRHLLMIDPDDKFGKETMERIREILFPQKKDASDENGENGQYQDTP